MALQWRRREILLDGVSLLLRVRGQTQLQEEEGEDEVAVIMAAGEEEEGAAL